MNDVTGSTFAIIMIVVAALAGLIIMEVMVLVAAERPYFKHAHTDQDQMVTHVRGGVHLGDPRSLGAPQEETVEEATASLRHPDSGAQRELEHAGSVRGGAAR